MLYDDLGITDQEELYDRMSHERLLEFINRKDAKVVECTRSSNSYGEFRFVTVIMPRNLGHGTFREAVTWYGNGYHEYRETSPDYWSFYVGNGCLYDKHPAMDKKAVIREIKEERAGMTFTNPVNNRYTFIADLTDDDYALSEM